MSIKGLGYLLIYSILILLLSSCATILPSKTHQVKFDGYEVGSEVFLKNSKKGDEFVKMGTTPFDLEIEEKGENTVKYVFKDGDTFEVLLKKKLNPMVFWNVLNYGAGLAVDIVTGKVLKPKNKVVFIENRDGEKYFYGQKKKSSKYKKKEGQDVWLLDREYFKPSIAVTFGLNQINSDLTLFKKVIDSIQVPIYFDHSVENKILGKYGSNSESVMQLLQENFIAHKMARKWWSNEGINTWTWDVYHERSLINANDDSFYKAIETKRGVYDLQDENFGLLNETYLANIEHGEIIDYKTYYDRVNIERKKMREGLLFGRLFFPNVNRKKTGYVMLNSNVHLFKLNYTKDIVGDVLTKFYVNDNSEYEKKKNSFLDYKLELIYEGSKKASLIEGGVNRTKNKRKKKKGKFHYSESDNYEMLMENSISHLMDKYKYDVASLNLRTSIYKSSRLPFNPYGVKVKLGLEDGLKAGKRYAVYEKKMNKSGDYKWKFKGGIVSSNKISDKTGRSKDGSDLSSFSQFSGGGKVKPGMKIEEIPFYGWSVSYSVMDGSTFRINKNISTAITNTNNFKGKQRKFIQGLELFVEYYRSSNSLGRYGYIDGDGSEDFSDFNIDSIYELRSGIELDSKTSFNRNKVRTKINAFNGGVSLNIPILTFLQVKPYFSVGLDWENASKKEGQWDYLLFNKDFTYLYTESSDVDSRSIALSVSYNYGARIMMSLRMHTGIFLEYGRRELASLEWYDNLSHVREKNVYKMGIVWNF